MNRDSNDLFRDILKLWSFMRQIRSEQLLNHPRNQAATYLKKYSDYLKQSIYINRIEWKSGNSWFDTQDYIYFSFSFSFTHGTISFHVWMTGRTLDMNINNLKIIYSEQQLWTQQRDCDNTQQDTRSQINVNFTRVSLVHFVPNLYIKNL